MFDGSRSQNIFAQVSPGVKLRFLLGDRCLRRQDYQKDSPELSAGHTGLLCDSADSARFSNVPRLSTHRSKECLYNGLWKAPGFSRLSGHYCVLKANNERLSSSWIYFIYYCERSIQERKARPRSSSGVGSVKVSHFTHRIISGDFNPSSNVRKFPHFWKLRLLQPQTFPSQCRF